MTRHRTEANAVLQRTSKEFSEVASSTQTSEQVAVLPDKEVMSGPLLSLPACPRFFPFATLASRIPWPDDVGSAPLNVAPASLRQMVDCPAPLVRLAYRLFYLPLAQGEALLSLTAAAAREVLVVDFKCAERNLELPCALLAAGLRGVGHAHASPFMRAGGLEGLVYRLGLTVFGRQNLLGGAAVMLRVSAQS